MNHLLGVEGTECTIIEEKSSRQDYTQKLSVSDEVIQWLDSHDIEYIYPKQKVYIVNAIRYIYLGFDFGEVFETVQ
jgi:hypothetical protein